MRNIHSLYEDCSGQIINKDKSSIMFSKNTSAEIKSSLMAALEINSEARNEKYLGLPVYMGKSKVQTFAYLKDRVWKRIQGWKRETFVQGREGCSDKSSCPSNSNICHVLL